MFCRNKKIILLEDTLITPFGLSSEEGAFELKNLRIHPYPYCIQLLLLVKEKKNYTLNRKLQAIYIHRCYKEQIRK